MSSGPRPRTPIRRRAAVSIALGAMLLAMLAIPSGAAAASYRDCSGRTPAAGADLHRCDLSGAVVIGQDLHGINLARANLVGVNAGCDPDQPRTNLAGAWLYRANATGALLCDAILNGADLHRANLTNASFEDATLTGREPGPGRHGRRDRRLRRLPRRLARPRHVAARRRHRGRSSTAPTCIGPTCAGPSSTPRRSPARTSGTHG